MRVVEFDEGKVQRRILLAMIVSREVALGVAQWWKAPGLFPSKQLNVVGNWCVDFVRRYDRALGRSVQARYEDWVQARHDREASQLVEAILRQISDDYVRCRQDINVGFTLDRARKYFNRVAYRKLADALKQAEEDDDLEKCDALQREFHRSEDVTSPVKDLLLDESLAESAFAERIEPLVAYSGALGQFYGNEFGRASFVAFLGSMGRGKSWELLDLAWKGLLQQRRVLFIETGDMTEEQIYRRFASRSARRPIFPRTVRFPLSLRGMSNGFEINFKDLIFDSGMNAQTIMEANRRVIRDYVRSDTSTFKLLCCPAGTLSAVQLKGILEDLERSDYVPDIICLDYADLMAMPYPYRDGRDKINALWTELRALSEMWNCCLATATQANRESMRTELISLYHASEDIRKAAHVTAMVGLNQIDTEKSQGVMRLNILKRRDDAFERSSFVYTAGCLALANPHVRSAFPESTESSDG